jgi:uncharacterized iron-regulated membrane protein
LELILLIWLPLCIAVAILADRYNRNPVAWLIASLLFSPLVGAAFVLALGPQAQMLTDQPSTGDTAPSDPPMAMAEAYRKAQEAHQLRAARQNW